MRNSVIILIMVCVILVVTFFQTTWFSPITPTTKTTNTHHLLTINLSWQCQNDIEVSCLDKQCESAEKNAFTPMQINLSHTQPNQSELSVCAYSGCWQGKATLHSYQPFIMMVGEQLAFSTDLQNDDQKQSIAITIDPSDGIGLIKVGSFSQPIICSKTMNSNH